MTKANTAAADAINAAEINFNATTDALKAGFEKAIAGYDSVLGYGKEDRKSVV